MSANHLGDIEAATGGRIEDLGGRGSASDSDSSSGIGIGIGIGIGDPARHSGGRCSLDAAHRVDRIDAGRDLSG